MYIYDWFMLIFDRKQQNSVKQLSFNKKINLKEKAQEKEMQKGKMAAWGDLTNSCEKKRSERPGRKWDITIWMQSSKE